MTEQTKQKLKYWLIGLFSGGAVAAPVTAFVCKKVNDKKVSELQEKAYMTGLNDMAAYAVQQQTDQNIQNTREIQADIEDILKGTEEPDEEDINNYDISIDDIDATEEARERTEAHERYLDMIGRYDGTNKRPPYTISEDEFANELYMEKSYVNWYEEDDVFEEDLLTIQDPYFTFGVTSGRELFKDAALRDDPDICYVRNENTATDFEISRIHGSYAKMVGGEASLGETDT